MVEEEQVLEEVEPVEASLAIIYNLNCIADRICRWRWRWWRRRRRRRWRRG